MWHGPALDALLADLTAAEAARRPVAGAHTVWELVAHMAVWAEIAAERVEGRGLEYPDDEVDWAPMPSRISAPAWAKARERLEHAYFALATLAGGLSDTAFDTAVPGQPPNQTHTVRHMLEGVVEHGVYHGGQIALLRRALTG